MGKGDRRSRRGKIYNGSFGKSRPKKPDAKKTTKKTGTAPAAPAAKAKAKR